MNHQEKIDWMINWAHKNKVRLELEGECGFGRECVGIIVNNIYPDYHWYDDDYNEIDQNGEIWIPENAYHKHPCVAVLGRGEKAEEQLFEWLLWFDENKFIIEVGFQPEAKIKKMGLIEILFGKHQYARIRKRKS